MEAKLTEEMLSRYYELQLLAKKIENELDECKSTFHAYFDQVEGLRNKGEEMIGDYKIQRQVRESSRLDDEKAVHLLEELNLGDCIVQVKRPDPQKVDAAVTLGLLQQADLEPCIVRKVTQAIVVKKAD